MTEDDGLDVVLQQAATFADDVTELLALCFPGAPEMQITQNVDRVKIAPIGQSEKQDGVPLQVDKRTLAWLRIDFLCRLDAAGKWMAIDNSKIWVVAAVDSTPIFRFEFLYETDWVPHSHIQVHGQRGALSHLLSRTGHPRPHEMSARHLPTGGSRFRPALEDVIQFLIVDCRFDRLESWGGRRRCASGFLATSSVKDHGSRNGPGRSRAADRHGLPGNATTKWAS